jgi:hypothetical protein
MAAIDAKDNTLARTVPGKKYSMLWRTNTQSNVVQWLTFFKADFIERCSLKKDPSSLMKN